MGTIVTIQLADSHERNSTTIDAHQVIERAFEWFREVERVCNRFDPASELRQLTSTPGASVQAGPLLFSLLEFALAIALESGGAFDPTVGRRMESRGFDRAYTTGLAIDPSSPTDEGASYRDVHVDRDSGRVTIDRPLTLDLGAVAKGFAIDLAAHELSAFRNFAIDAGGDLYVAGRNDAGLPWSIGVRHPRQDREAITRLQLSDAAICTSGDYERQSDESGHHIIDPRAGVTQALKTSSSAYEQARDLASVTVVAPTAMLADALATAAFVLGPVEGLRLLERHGVDGLMYSPTLDRFETAGIAGLETRG